MSIRQSEHMMRFLMVLHDLKLIPEAVFADTATYFDDIIRDVYDQYSWETPSFKWFTSSER